MMVLRGTLENDDNSPYTGIKAKTFKFALTIKR